MRKQVVRRDNYRLLHSNEQTNNRSRRKIAISGDDVSKTSVIRHSKKKRLKKSKLDNISNHLSPKKTSSLGKGYNHKQKTFEIFLDVCREDLNVKHDIHYHRAALVNLLHGCKMQKLRLKIASARFPKILCNLIKQNNDPLEQRRVKDHLSVVLSVFILSEFCAHASISTMLVNDGVADVLMRYSKDGYGIFPEGLYIVKFC